MPTVVIITTGGTIASGRDPQSGAGRMIQGQDLISAIPELADGAEIEVQEFCRIASSQVPPEEMFRLGQQINTVLARPEVAGVVITHGTDTLEETATMLSVIVHSAKPTVITGSMRIRRELGSDGPRNVWASVRTVLHPYAMGKGVMIVLNDDLFAGHEVTKTHSTRPDTFAAPGLGPIGRSDSDGVVFFRQPSWCPHIPTDRVETNVDLIKCVAGMDDRYVKASAAAGAKGIVVETMGKGNLPRSLAEGLKIAADSGMVIVLVTRCPEGGVFPAGLMRETDVIYAPDINGQKARIRLMAALGHSKNMNYLRDVFRHRN